MALGAFRDAMKRLYEFGCLLAARSRTSTSALHASACASKVAPRQAAPLHLGGRRCASTALRFSVAWPVAKLTALTSFAAFRQTATSQLWMRAARAATRPAMLGASEALRSLPGRAFATTSVVFGRRTPSVPERQAVLGGGDFCGDEQRNAVAAKRRPPQHEPPADTACRDARTSQASGCSRMAATGRMPPLKPRAFFSRHAPRCGAAWRFPASGCARSARRPSGSRRSGSDRARGSA